MLLAASFIKIGFVVVGLVVVAALVVLALRKKGDDTVSKAPVEDVTDLTIKNAKVGDVITARGAADGFEDLVFTVDRRNVYKCGVETWFEISGKFKATRVFVEVFEDDELETSIDKGEKLKLSDLGITEEDLIKFDEEEDDSSSIKFRDQDWNYSDSDDVRYFKDGNGQGEGFYQWEFENDDGETLFVEKFEGDPFVAGIQRPIDPDSFQVFRS